MIIHEQAAVNQLSVCITRHQHQIRNINNKGTKMNTIRPSLVLTAILGLLLTSCAHPPLLRVQYHGVQPASPMPPLTFDYGANGSINWMGQRTPSKCPVVESLQPTLSWKPVDSGATKFDLIICQGEPKPTSARFLSPSTGATYYVDGKRVYYREGLEGCSHRVEQPLSPRTIYVWAVRTRSGSDVGPWSTYSFQGGLLPVHGAASMEAENFWWSFRTP